MVILETRNLTKVFSNGVAALQEVNFCVRRGEMVVVAGCNGSGKTVLARHLNGLLRPSTGEVLVAGEAVTRNPAEARRRVGLVFQDSDSQIVGETVTADVAFGPENLGLAPAEVTTRVTWALEAVGLTACAAWRPQQLSGGQKRKLAIAGVLAMRPQIMVLDEPFTGLDYPGVVQVLTQLVRLRRDGQTLVVITHELEKVLAHADRLAILYSGKLVAAGRPEELLDRVEEYGIKKPFGANRPVETMTWLK
jgi:biotin transport system ATP-binding protein